MGSSEYKKEYMRKYYQENKEKWKIDTPERKARKDKNTRTYETKNRQDINARRRQWTVENFEKNLLMQVKKRSRKSGMECNIDLSDIIIPEVCPYLGCKITKILGQGVVWTNPSIDRIDNSKGYVKGNVEIISYLANSMKRNATIAELVAFAEGVLKKFGTGRLSSSSPNCQNFSDGAKKCIISRF